MQRLSLSGEYFLLLPFFNLFNNTPAHTIVPEKQSCSGHVTHDGGLGDYNLFWTRQPFTCASSENKQCSCVGNMLIHSAGDE